MARLIMKLTQQACRLEEAKKPRRGLAACFCTNLAAPKAAAAAASSAAAASASEEEEDPDDADFNERVNFLSPPDHHNNQKEGGSRRHWWWAPHPCTGLWVPGNHALHSTGGSPAADAAVHHPQKTHHHQLPQLWFREDVHLLESQTP